MKFKKDHKYAKRRLILQALLFEIEWTSIILLAFLK